MAGYSTINAQFRPMSYQEMLAPVVAADTEHKAIEEQLSQLNVLASQWEEKLAKEAPGSKVRSMYQNYVNDLKSQSDLLSQKGLNSTSRKALSDMKARYTSDIVPIEEAYNLRATRAEEQRQLQLSDPSYLIERNLGDVSIQEFMDNPNLSSKGISGAYITKIVADGAAALAKEMKDNPRKWRSILNGQQYETLMQKGFSTEEVLKAIQANPNAAPELTVLVENAINMSGIKDWQNNQDVINKGYQFARQGLYNAIGDTQYQLVLNEDYLNPLQQAQLDAMQPQNEPTSYASTHSYFDVNQHDSDFSSIKGKLFKDGYTSALTTLFGQHGETNPMAIYESAKRQLGKEGIAAYNEKVSALAAKYGLEPGVTVEKLDNGRYNIVKRGANGNTVPLTGNFLKEWQQLQAQGRQDDRTAARNSGLISDKEYEALKKAGVTSKDNIQTIREKMSAYEDSQSRIYTGYDLGITNYDYVDKQLSRTISQDGSAALTLLDNKFEKTGSGTGSRTGRLFQSDDFKYEKNIKGQIAGMEYVPKAGGLVLFTEDGRRYLVNKGAIKDQVDFIIKNNKGINEFINRGNEVIAHDLQGNPITGYQYAQELIRDNLNAVIPQLTHSENSVQSSTSSYPFGLSK